MLTLFRRHTAACRRAYAPSNRAGLDCDCFLHAEGVLGRELVRSTTGTRSMQRARKMVVAAEERGSWLPPVEAIRIPPTPAAVSAIPAAIAAFLHECESPKARNLSPASMDQYRSLLGKLSRFCEVHGYADLTELTHKSLTAFRDSWNIGPAATATAISRMRAFMAFSVQMGYCATNVAKGIKKPKPVTERLPFSEDEMKRIVSNAEMISGELAAFVLLMRWSAMAISDAALFELAELVGDEVRYYRNKQARNPKKKLAVIPLPPFVLARLESLPLHHGKYFFCHGSDVLINAVKPWHKAIREVLDAAGIKGSGRSHRFRHTFATDMLSRGKSIENVAQWLGNTPKMVQDTYSHWIESRVKVASDELREIHATIM